MKGYYIGVNQVHTIEPRSPSKDTVHLSVRVQVGDHAYPARTLYEGELGDWENGVNPRLVLGPLPAINSATKLTLFYQVVNSSSKDYKKMAALFVDLANTAAEKLLATGDPWAAAGAGVLKIATFIAPILTAKCDGLLALDVIAKSGAQVEALLSPARYEETREYPGTDSPAGCGKNSLYRVTWEVWRSPWSGWLEVPHDGLTDVGLAATTFRDSLYLFGKGLDDDQIYVNRTTTDKDWTGWRRDIPGEMRTDVSVAAAGAERLWLFAKRPTDDEIMWNSFDGAAWSDWNEVGGKTSSVLPQASSFAAARCPATGLGGPTVALFRRGPGDDDRIYMTVDKRDPSSGPSGWEPWQEVPGGRTRGGLAAVAFRESLYLFCLGEDYDIYMNMTHDLVSWVGWSVVPGGQTSDVTPGVAVLSSQAAQPVDPAAFDPNRFDPDRFEDRLHLFVKPAPGSGPIMFASYPVGEGTAAFPSWSKWQEVPGSGWPEAGKPAGLPAGHLDRGTTDAGLSAAGHRHRLYLFSKDLSSTDMSQHIFVNAWDGTQGLYSKDKKW